MAFQPSSAFFVRLRGKRLANFAKRSALPFLLACAPFPVLCKINFVCSSLPGIFLSPGLLKDVLQSDRIIYMAQLQCGRRLLRRL